MRILHIIQRYWPARGGAEIYLGEISSRLAADGHQVTVATTDALDFELFWDPRRRRVTERQAYKDSVRILRFPVRHLPLPRLAYPGWRRLLWLLSALRPLPVSMLSYLARYTPWVPDLWRWLASTEETFDLVAGMNVCFEPLLEAGLRFARERRIPYIVYPLTHLGAGAEPGQDPLSRFYTMRHQVDVVRASDAVIAQTPAERVFYEQRGVPRDRVLVAGAGVNSEEVLGGNGERFRDRHGLHGPLVACISAMAYDKGTVHLVEAVRRLWREGRQVELALAGAILAPFRLYLSGLPPADLGRIRVLGQVTEEEKRDLLDAADVFAMPSRTESFGIVYLEAWLYKKPVIGAQTWGVSDVIEDERDGLLVPFGDVPALAAAISRLLDHPDERARLGARGEQKVRRLHTWDRKYELVSDLYRRLVVLPDETAAQAS
jgi:glycosyltransferase involved in cell wall biosynthesis